MSRFAYIVEVDAPTKEQADQVMAERVLPEEEYDFVGDYSIAYRDVEQDG